MTCKHSEETCPECAKTEKLSAAMTRLRRAILKSAEGDKPAAPKDVTPKAPDTPSLGKGPDMSVSIGGTSISAGIKNPLPTR